MPAKVIKRKNKKTKRMRRMNAGALAALVVGIIAMSSSFGFSSAYAVLETQQYNTLVMAERSRAEVLSRQASSGAVLGQTLEFCGCCQFAGRLVLESTGNTTLCAIMDSKSECEFLGGNCLEKYSCSRGVRCEPVL